MVLAAAQSPALIFSINTSSQITKVLPSSEVNPNLSCSGFFDVPKKESISSLLKLSSGLNSLNCTKNSSNYFLVLK